MKTLVNIIDLINEWTGNIARWLAALLVIVLVYESAARYIFDAPTIWAYETASMVGAALIALGLGYTHKYHGHVRIDAIYGRFSQRGKAIIDILCTLLLFFPLIIILAKTATTWTLSAIALNEKSQMSFWYPPTSPIRATIVVGLVLFALQGAAEFIRDLYFVIRGKPL